MINDKVYITADALSEILRLSIARGRLETAGLLVGKVTDDEIIIHGSETGKQSATSVHVEISEEALIQAVIRVSESNEEDSIVGWWHTHPGLTTFMSPTDINTQKRYQQFFDRAVAIVIDPVKYAETHDLSDLDIRMFRVNENDEAYEIPLEITASIDDIMRLLTFEAGSAHQDKLMEMTHGNKNADLKTVETSPVTIELPSHQEIEEALYNLSSLKQELPGSVVIPIETWLSIMKLMKGNEKALVHVDARLREELKKINDELSSLNKALEFTANEHYKKTSTQFSFLTALVLILIAFSLL